MTLNDYEYDADLHALCCPPEPECSWTPNRLTRDRRLSINARVAGMILASYLQSGEPLPDLDTMATHMPCSPRDLARALAELAAAGWIQPKDGP